MKHTQTHTQTNKQKDGTTLQSIIHTQLRRMFRILKGKGRWGGGVEHSSGDMAWTKQKGEKMRI